VHGIWHLIAFHCFKFFSFSFSVRMEKSTLDFLDSDFTTKQNAVFTNFTSNKNL
jgi:hypothetical protein